MLKMIPPFLSDIHFKVSPSVSEALVQNKPVVALESTIITHGMPYPHNLRCSQDDAKIKNFLSFQDEVLKINYKLVCCFCSALQRRLRPLCELKEPLLPRSASLKG